MTKVDLSSAIHQLHVELGDGRQLDPKTLQLLRELLEELQSVVTRSEPSKIEDSPTPMPLTQRVVDVIADFEVRHPQLTATLQQIADRLADMGI